MDINPVVQPIVITWQVSSWEAETGGQQVLVSVIWTTPAEIALGIFLLA